MYEDMYKFSLEIKSKPLIKEKPFYEAHYKGGQLIDAIKVRGSNILEKIKFDSVGRMTFFENDNEICKWNYSIQIKESWCSDKKGNFISHEKLSFKDNLLIKLAFFDK